jgi:ABC-type cobalamin transport system permease subunit
MFLRTLHDRPLIFALIVTLFGGLLGSAGLLRSRYGKQLVPAGLVGFAYGAAIGLFVSVSLIAADRVGFRSSSGAKILGLVGALVVTGVFLLIAR